MVVPGYPGVFNRQVLDGAFAVSEQAVVYAFGTDEQSAYGMTVSVEVSRERGFVRFSDGSPL